MLRDKYNALWVSYSSITDYIKCPRAYFLKNIYRDSKNGKRIQIMQPALALGQIIHDVIDQISFLPVSDRLNESIVSRYEALWKKVSGINGGFKEFDEENKYKERGYRMISNIEENPGPILRKSIKIRQNLPHIWLDEKENIILCGKIDWLEYFPETDSIGIIDFKTGKFDEDPESLQLFVYFLLIRNIQKRQVSKASYWYLDRDQNPLEIELPDFDQAKKEILEIAKRIELAKKLEHFKCNKKNGCFACSPYEKILLGQAQKIGINNYNQEVYVL
jgi:ATP-dependent helicase/DNAse subunit B